jgi:hypothetical protein
MATIVVLVAGYALAETAAPGFSITEVYTATKVSRGVPETKTTTFQRNKGFIYCFVVIDNPSGNGNEILVGFEEAEGQPTKAFRGTKLRIPARYKHRTVARTGSNMPAGQYRCVVRSRTGEVLETTDFQVTE